ncbi:MAG TPA: hypothetical protein GX527_03895 [Clostridiaceae bacterium]|jgi:RNA-directed DNA polymerase|nr:hypothetical protein [Clostridiaceae bacterium]
MHSIYGQILVERKLMAAWQQVADNKGSGGIDGVTINTFKSNEEENIKDLLTKLKDKTYKPTPVKRVYIPKKNGKLRPLGIPTVSANCTKVQYPFGKCHDHTPISSIMWPGI